MKQIITSKTFLERAKLNVQAMRDAGIGFIYLEDVRAKIPRWRQWRSLLRVFLESAGPGIPKPRSEVGGGPFHQRIGSHAQGVELTHTNLLVNIRQLLAVYDLNDADRLFNAMPLFHSFGVIGMALPLIHGCYVFLYPSPLHYRVIPTLLYDLDCTVFFGTNTFLNGYARKASPFDFRSLRLLLRRRGKIAGSDRQHLGAAIWRARSGRLTARPNAARASQSILR